MMTKTRKMLLRVARTASSGLIHMLKAEIEFLKEFKQDKPHWVRECDKMLQWLDNPTTTPPYKVFVEGNAKLPFYSFSALPIVTCPGMGKCGDWCYSLKAWRYPSAFLRQVQNTFLLMGNGYKFQITLQFFRLPQDINLRLYVDGDFDSVSTVSFWMNLLRDRSDIMAYGYSKSWMELAQYHLSNMWPENYVLNLSDGSIHEQNEPLKKLVASMPISRGEFVGVDTTHKGNDRYSDSEYKKEVRDNYGDRCFVCPGKCGECLPSGSHACGSHKFDDIPIVIGIH